MTWGSPRASLYVKCVGTVRAASHPPVWIHRMCELRSLKKTLNGLCLDDDYTIAQWLEHRWLQARVPGSSPGGDSQFFLQTFPVCLFPSNQLIIIILIINMASGVFFTVASFPDIFSPFLSLTSVPALAFPPFISVHIIIAFLSLFAVMCLPCLHYS